MEERGTIGEERVVEAVLRREVAEEMEKAMKRRIGMELDFKEIGKRLQPPDVPPTAKLVESHVVKKRDQRDGDWDVGMRFTWEWEE